MHTRHVDSPGAGNVRQELPGLRVQSSAHDSAKTATRHISSTRWTLLRMHCEARSSGRSVGRMCFVDQQRESSGVHSQKVREGVCYRFERSDLSDSHIDRLSRLSHKTSMAYLQNTKELLDRRLSLSADHLRLALVWRAMQFRHLDLLSLLS
jgi:predicted enzyme involved in methoxymalonyl-ACP biosynthesis